MSFTLTPPKESPPPKSGGFLLTYPEKSPPPEGGGFLLIPPEGLGEAPAPGPPAPHPLMAAGQRVMEAIQAPAPDLYTLLQPQTRLGQAALLPLQGAVTAASKAMAPFAALPPVVTAPLVPERATEFVAGLGERYPAVSGTLGAGAEIVRQMTSPLVLGGMAMRIIRPSLKAEVQRGSPETPTEFPELVPPDQAPADISLRQQVRGAVRTGETAPLPASETARLRGAAKEQGLKFSRTPSGGYQIGSEVYDTPREAAEALALTRPSALPPEGLPFVDELRGEVALGAPDRLVFLSPVSGGLDWYDKAEVMALLDRAKTGQPLTPPQHEILNRLFEAARADKTQGRPHGQWFSAPYPTTGVEAASAERLKLLKESGQHPEPSLTPAPGEPDVVGPPRVGSPPPSPTGPFPISGGSPLFDPDVPLTRPPHLTFIERAKAQTARFFETLPRKFPQESAIVRRIPQSPVISTVTRHATWMHDQIGESLRHPWAVAASKIEPFDWMMMEHGMIQRFKAGLTPEALGAIHQWEMFDVPLPEEVIQQVQAAKASAVQSMPKIIQDLMASDEVWLRGAQDAARSLGVESVPEVLGPYLPRMTNPEYREAVKILKQWDALSTDLSQSVGSFQKPRVFETMVEGELSGQARGIPAGEVYADPRLAWAYRRWRAIKLVGTDNLMKDLEARGVLFRSREAAQAASPVGEAVPVEGLPGLTVTGPEPKAARMRGWWTTSREEAEFLRHNFQGRTGDSRLATAVHVMNQVFRNVNLFNPLPHMTKNMFVKFLETGGDPLAAGPSMARYLSIRHPDLLEKIPSEIRATVERMIGPGDRALVEEFSSLYPSSNETRMAGDLVHRFVPPDRIAQVLTSPSRLSRPSSAMIFKYFDPALRYARWSQYVKQGMTGQEAANHVFVDLVNYGTRSDIIDAWKSVPGNFFVPWRFGTVTTLLKQLRSGALPATRVAFTIAALDYLREAYHRNSPNAQWLHLPHDYIEYPIAQAFTLPWAQHPLAATGMMLSTAAGTALVGPGGQYTADTLRNLWTIASGRPGSAEWERMVNMFWGLSVAYNVPKEMLAYEQDRDLRHIQNVIGAVGLGMHSALSYEPRRLMKWMPEWMPFMEKSAILRYAEAQRGRAETLRERAEFRRATRAPGLYEWLTETQEEKDLQRLSRMGRRR